MFSLHSFMCTLFFLQKAGFKIIGTLCYQLLAVEASCGQNNSTEPFAILCKSLETKVSKVNVSLTIPL